MDLDNLRESVEHDYIRNLKSQSCKHISVESRVLDLESEAMRGRGSIPTGGNILSLDYFHVVKPLMTILSICEKPEWGHNMNIKSKKVTMEQNIVKQSE